MIYRLYLSSLSLSSLGFEAFPEFSLIRLAKSVIVSLPKLPSVLEYIVNIHYLPQSYLAIGYAGFPLEG